MRRVFVLTDESSREADAFASDLRAVVDDRAQVVNLWVGDPNLAPKWARLQRRSAFGPTGLFYLALPYDFFRLFVACAAELADEDLCSSVVVDPVGFIPGVSWAGEVAPGGAFRFARTQSEVDLKFGALPDVWDLGSLDRDSLLRSTKALSFGRLPPSLSVGCSPIDGFIQRSIHRHEGCLLAFDSDLRALVPPQRRALPGGYVIDEAVARVARELLFSNEGDPDSLPDPYGSGLQEFIDFAEAPQEEWRGSRGRIWQFLWEARPDLQENFPLPDGRDWERYGAWCEARFSEEGGSGLFRGFGERYGKRFSNSSDNAVTPASALNLVGYLSSANSQGAVARQVFSLLRGAGLDVAAVDYDRVPSPRLPGLSFPFAGADARANLLFVGPDVFFNEYFQSPELFSGKRNVAYWFWELESVPERLVRSAGLVDEVWAPTRFVTDALSSAFACPVDYVPLPVPPPIEPAREAPFADFGARPVFLTIFDFFSSEQRKNPEGAIRAFIKAFPRPGVGPVLILKSLNGRSRPDRLRRLEQVAAGREDIIFVDEVWSAPLLSAALRDASCLVSLHRSEGLGLTPLEALWLRTPSIVTAFGGICDYEDLTKGGTIAPMRFVEFDRAQVGDRENIYPEDGEWAEPDVGRAAQLMLELIDGTWQPDTAVGVETMRLHYNSKAERFIERARDLDTRPSSARRR